VAVQPREEELGEVAEAFHMEGAEVELLDRTRKVGEVEEDYQWGEAEVVPRIGAAHC